MRCNANGTSSQQYYSDKVSPTRRDARRDRCLGLHADTAIQAQSCCRQIDEEMAFDIEEEKHSKDQRVISMPSSPSMEGTGKEHCLDDYFPPGFPCNQHVGPGWVSFLVFLSPYLNTEILPPGYVSGMKMK